ncbi:MAG: hypothetical protein ISN29_10780 [Gammaproteobacteria bacterium AqS3]|nr:hypothetical protein [Gammaproteobacteria bacterium AqS3]
MRRLQKDELLELFNHAGLAYWHHALRRPDAGAPATMDQCAQLAQLCHSRGIDPYTEIKMTKLPRDYFPSPGWQFFRKTNMDGLSQIILVEDGWLALSERQATAAIKRISEMPAQTGGD